MKEILGITDTSQDTEVTNLLVEADAWIDGTLTRWGLGVSGSTPALIAAASNYLASARYRRERLAPALANAYEQLGNANLNLYIASVKSGVSTVSRENL